jgi:plastocyanin
MKSLWIVCKRVSYLLLVLVILGSCSSPSEEGTPEPGTAIEEPKPEMHSVEITQMKFFPAEIKVKKGDKLVFVNHDLVTHDVTEESKKAWSSSPLATDQTWVLTVTESVNYFCSIHPVMKGKVVVE